ncbi:MAG: DUF1585 domain-containing protein [Alphaproteobacteria bacterium]|nr:DUF1585 domain-containing protein [Alphaproteobacteria bacterium]
MSALLVLACAGEPTPVDSAPTVPHMSAERLLTRASLDLRRHRPAPEELAAVAADPDAVDDYIADYLQDPGFGAAVRDWFAVPYRTLLDDWPRRAADYGLGDEPGFARAIGEEPLRILSTIATEDLPYTTLVTADWTMANEVLASAWPIDYSDGASGWQQARYTDGRPPAGVLSTNGLWWRYETSRTNKNRSRAAALSRILLCDDFLDRTITFDREVDLSDEQVAAEALVNNPGCVSCHASLDPLASYLGGFYFPKKSGVAEMTVYHPEREDIWRWLTGAPPAYFGEPGETLTDLGHQIAADPRFIECAVEQTWTFMLQREPALSDIPALSAAREDFLAGGLTLRALAASVVQADDYRAEHDLKLMSPDLLASQVEALTGFTFVSEGYDLMRTDTLGLRALAGGADGNFVTERAASPTATTVLVQERLAQAAANHVVAQDRAGADRRLLTLVDPDSFPPEDLARAQLVELHQRILSATPDAESEDELYALLLDVAETTGQPHLAWVSVITVMMRDPSFVMY